jgi:hypothetical protein
MHNTEDHIDLMIDFVSKKQNPTKLEFGAQPNKISNIWNYNIFLKILYPYLRRLSRLFKSIHK